MLHVSRACERRAGRGVSGAERGTGGWLQSRTPPRPRASPLHRIGLSCGPPAAQRYRGQWVRRGSLWEVLRLFQTAAAQLTPPAGRLRRAAVAARPLAAAGPHLRPSTLLTLRGIAQAGCWPLGVAAQRSVGAPVCAGCGPACVCLQKIGRQPATSQPQVPLLRVRCPTAPAPLHATPRTLGHFSAAQWCRRGAGRAGARWAVHLRVQSLGAAPACWPCQALASVSAVLR